MGSPCGRVRQRRAALCGRARRRDPDPPRAHTVAPPQDVMEVQGVGFRVLGFRVGVYRLKCRVYIFLLGFRV